MGLNALTSGRMLPVVTQLACLTVSLTEILMLTNFHFLLVTQVTKGSRRIQKGCLLLPSSQPGRSRVLQARQGPLRVETFISSTWNTQVKRAFRNSSQKLTRYNMVIIRTTRRQYKFPQHIRHSTRVESLSKQLI